MRKFVRLLMPIVVAVMVGPLIGGLIFCLLAIYTSFFDPATPVADLFVMFGIYIGGAYLIGGPVALLAGLLVSIWMIWRQPSFVAVNAAAIAAIGLCFLSDRIGLSGPIPIVSNNLGLMLAVAIIAANVCWLLTRRFVKTV
jgi:hypothetical protein